MKKLSISLALYLALSVAAVSLSSCNTYIGMGRDIQKLGQGVQNTGYGKGWKGDKPPAQQPPAQAPAQTH